MYLQESFLNRSTPPPLRHIQEISCHFLVSRSVELSTKVSFGQIRSSYNSVVCIDCIVALSSRIMSLVCRRGGRWALISSAKCHSHDERQFCIQQKILKDNFVNNNKIRTLWISPKSYYLAVESLSICVVFLFENFEMCKFYFRFLSFSIQ